MASERSCQKRLSTCWLTSFPRCAGPDDESLPAFALYLLDVPLQALTLEDVYLEVALPKVEGLKSPLYANPRVHLLPFEEDAEHAQVLVRCAVCRAMRGRRSVSFANTDAHSMSPLGLWARFSGDPSRQTLLVTEQERADLCNDFCSVVAKKQLYQGATPQSDEKLDGR